MTIAAGDYSYMGVGKVFMREYGSSAALLHVGNAGKLDFSVSEDVKEQKDYTAGGGGTVAEVRRISAVEAGIQLFDLDKNNIAKAVFGTASSLTAGPVSAEAQTAYVGGIVPTNKPINTGASVTVKDVTDATTYVAGEDYTVSSGGITILSGSDIEDGDVIHITYSSLAHDIIEALTTNAKEYELFFEGMNEAKDGRAVNVKAHRIKFGATQLLSLIGDDFASIELKGKLLRDNTKTGTGVSKYFKVQVAGE